MKSFILIFILALSFTTHAQISGIIKDQVTEQGIPYVNFQVMGSRYGTSSDQFGKFNLAPSQDDSVVISAIGYKTKIIAYSDITESVLMKPIIYKLPEVVIGEQSKEIELGRVRKNGFGYTGGAVSGFPYMMARYFEYEESITECPYIKFIQVATESDIDSAMFNVRLYKVDSTGLPGEPLYSKNILSYASEGKNITLIDIEKEYLIFPKEGLYVAVEWLQLKENEFEISYEKDNVGKGSEKIQLEPSFALEAKPIKAKSTYYLKGKWTVDNFVLRGPQMRIVLRN